MVGGLDEIADVGDIAVEEEEVDALELDPLNSISACFCLQPHNILAIP